MTPRSSAATALFDDLTALADATRSRMLLLLERYELTVSELCAVLQLPQSTVSRHLKTLADAAWVVSRRDGTSRYYSLALDRRDASTRRLWAILREQMAETASVLQDGRRLNGVLARRQATSDDFFASAAGKWDHLREELFGRRSMLLALAGLADERWVLGDLGCGTGQVSATLAPFVARVVAIDRSGDMLQAARRRLQRVENVEVRRGDLASLPVEDGELDAAVVLLVLHHVPDPAVVLQEAARALAPSGRIVICDMLPHDREAYRQQMGHVWLGFAETQIDRLMEQAGFHDRRIVSLPADPDVRGPALFVATGRRKGDTHTSALSRRGTLTVPGLPAGGTVSVPLPGGPEV